MTFPTIESLSSHSKYNTYKSLLFLLISPGPHYQEERANGEGGDGWQLGIFCHIRPNWADQWSLTHVLDYIESPNSMFTLLELSHHTSIYPTTLSTPQHPWDLQLSWLLHSALPIKQSNNKQIKEAGINIIYVVKGSWSISLSSFREHDKINFHDQTHVDPRPP